MGQPGEGVQRNLGAVDEALESDRLLPTPKASLLLRIASSRSPRGRSLSHTGT
jgi:hypothetical protein